MLQVEQAFLTLAKRTLPEREKRRQPYLQGGATIPLHPERGNIKPSSKDGVSNPIFMMSQTRSDQVRFTTADLELLPDHGDRYEIIDGELFVTRAPHWGHQKAIGNLYQELNTWSRETNLGEAGINPGLIFTDADNVIPDLVWASNERLAILLDEAGHLTAAPELIVQVLSPGADNERRDRDLKLRLFRCEVSKNTGL